MACLAVSGLRGRRATRAAGADAARWRRRRRRRERGCAARTACPALPTGERALRAVAAGHRRCAADVVLKPRDPAALDAFDTAVSTPGSPSFRHYLAPGHSPGSSGRAPPRSRRCGAGWPGRGLSVGPTSGDGLIVPIVGHRRPGRPGLRRGARAVPPALGPGGARRPIAEPLVPGALAGDLYGVAGLDDLSRARARAGPFRRRRRRVRRSGGDERRGAGRRHRRYGRRVPAPSGRRGPPRRGVRATIQSTARARGALTVDHLAVGVLVLEPLPRRPKARA